jgi:predicted small secreted protein
MKNKTSILVGTRHFFYALLVAVIFCGCNATDGAGNDMKPEQTYEIKVIDSCEYIYVSCRPFDRTFSLTHKGNCKFCAERSKK